MKGKKNVPPVNDELFEVESIIDAKKVKNKVLYLVKWKNYPVSESTWEPETNLVGAQRILRDFKSRNKAFDINDLKIENAFVNGKGEIIFEVKNRNNVVLYTRKELIDKGYTDKIIEFYEKLIKISDKKIME